MPIPLPQLFATYLDRYIEQDKVDRYRGACEEAAAIRSGRELGADFLRQIWRNQHFGPASVSQGIVSPTKYAAAEPLLREVTLSLIATPTADAMQAALDRLEEAKSQRLLQRIPWAMVSRLMATAAPETYTCVVTDSYQRCLIIWLNSEYGLGIPTRAENWAVKDKALRAALIRQGLPDDDPYLVNTFAWALADGCKNPEKSFVLPAVTPDREGREAALSSSVPPTPLALAPPLALNTIFYGPPGTGKTRKALEILATCFTTFQPQVSADKWQESLVQERLWREVLAAVLKDMNGKATVPEMTRHPLVAAKFRCGKALPRNERLWACLQMHSRVGSATVQVADKRPPELFDKGPTSVWQLLPDWEEKTPEAVALLAEYRRGRPRVADEERRYRTVTFHQSYSYEDFVEGIRPVLGEEEGESGLTYLLRDGVFKRMCAEARSHPDQNFAVFIDEINRGNICKIFGELISLIEAGKRRPVKRAAADDSGVTLSRFNPEAMEVTLPYSQERFSVPSNLYIIGTMNSADRSLALLDTAMRRRFSFERVDPDPSLLAGKEVAGVKLDELLATLNRRIAALYDEDHCLGHSFFLKVGDFGALQRLFHNEIIPLLKEYFFDDWEKIRLVLGETYKEDHEGLCFLAPLDDLDTVFPGQAVPGRSLSQWRQKPEAPGDPLAFQAIYDPSVLAGR